LIQWFSQDHLRFQNIPHGKGKGLAFELQIAAGIKDMTVVQRDYLLLLKDGPVKSLGVLTPPLSRMERKFLMADLGSIGLKAARVNWKDYEVPANVEWMLAARDSVYLLAPDNLYILRQELYSYRMSFDLTARAAPSTCNWESFALRDWCVDPYANLYLLGEDGAIWKYASATMRWAKLPTEATLANPRFICADWTHLTVLNEDVGYSLRAYATHDLKLAAIRKIVDDGQLRGDVRQVYSNGYCGIYFVTSQQIYLLDQEVRRSNPGGEKRLIGS
jgi:hypothetical protein